MKIAYAVTVGALLAGWLAGHAVLAHTKQTGAANGRAVVVPEAATSPELDGELDDDAWRGAARTGAFVDERSGGPAAFHADARLVWSGEDLVVGLYAADDDIVAPETRHDAPLWTDDHFEIDVSTETGDYLVTVSARGVVTDARRTKDGTDMSWESHARVAVDRDGTLDVPGDTDEEWLVEVALPLRTMGITTVRGTTLSLGLRRCNVVAGRRTCAVVSGGRVPVVLR